MMPIRKPLVMAGSLLAMSALLLCGCSANGGDSKFEQSGSGGNGGNHADPDSGTGGMLNTDDAGSSIDWENCGKATYGAIRVPANVLLLVDSSGSMLDCPDGKDSCSVHKWDGAQTAISGALSSAPPELGVGLVFFPAGKYKQGAGCQMCLQQAMQNNGYPTDPNCNPILYDCGCEDVSLDPDVPVDKLGVNLSSINAKLSGKSPNGNTPTLHALEAAYYYMQNLKRDGDKYVLLMTDGDPTVHTERTPIPGTNFATPEAFGLCKDLADIMTTAQKAATGDSAKGLPPVKTFVVGSPGVKHFGPMSQLAKIGGTARLPTCDTSDNCGNNDSCCYYQIGNSNFSADLQTVLSEIAGQLATCTFAIPAGDGDVDPNLVNVRYKVPGGEQQDLYKDPSHQDGWDYTDDTHTKVEIYGDACDAIKKNTESEVTIILGCKTALK